jgi:ankyrin repeat protein
MRPEKCNEPDSLWVSDLTNDAINDVIYTVVMWLKGFTPLHLAANQGNESSVKFLLSFGCSIYKKDNVKLFTSSPIIEVLLIVHISTH